MGSGGEDLWTDASVIPLNMETTPEILLSHWDNDKSYQETAHQFLEGQRVSVPMIC